MNPRISFHKVPAVPAWIPWRELAFAIVESPAEVRFVAAGPELSSSQYPKGVAFGPDAELRWLRRANGLFHLVYVNDRGALLPEYSGHAELQELQDEDLPRQIFCWNADDGRIPAVPSYPSNIHARRLAVRIKHYDLGSTRIFRCVALEPAETQQ